MVSDTGIICFRHCCSKSIFCKSVPEFCPVCSSRILDYKLEPFLLPYPYVIAADEPNSIVLRPSQGNFLNDYDTTDDLHIGITNSHGIVFEYDKQGIVINDSCNWTNCIAIKIIPPSWDNHWNETLEVILAEPKWKSENYNDISMNCFNFVIEFLNNLQYMSMTFVDKESMCEKLILPKMNDMLKYNSIFKKLEAHEFFVS